MSIRARPRLVFEAPNFGFGPVASMLSIIQDVCMSYECSVVTTGTAQRLVRSAQPRLSVIDLDTFHAASWKRLLDILSSNSILVSNTNPHLAAWALKQGIRVAVVDTLFWMWDDLPSGLGDAEVYASQWYFGRDSDVSETHNAAGLPLVWTRPNDVPIEKQHTIHPSSRTAVISFGGMGMPLDDRLPIEYSRWVLSVALPILLASDAVDEIVIIGGAKSLISAVPRPYRTDVRLRVLGFLPPPDYIRLLRSSVFQLLTPGLATIYEANRMNISPMFLPGYNMSMLLQAWDYEHGAASGVGDVCEWTWAGEMVGKIRTMPEALGVEALSSHIRSAISGCVSSNPDTVRLEQSITHYLSRDRHLKTNAHQQSGLLFPSHLPTASTALLRAFDNAYVNN